MTWTAESFGRVVVRGCGPAAGALGVVLALTGCSTGQPNNLPTPSSISIAPSSATPNPSTPGPTSTGATPNSTVGTPGGESTISRSERVGDAQTAVAIAEATVADSKAVDVSQDDDGSASWEVIVRAGKNGRALVVEVADGTVSSNRSEQLDQAQLGEPPAISIRRAIEIAEKSVAGGVVTEVELGREDGQQVWDVVVTASGGQEWELRIDTSSGKVLHQEHD